MLEIRALSITHRSRILTRDIDLTLPAQGITALIGPSGCGKSTLLKWLAGVLPQDMRAAGQLIIDGAPAARPNPAICYQPQSDTLLPWADVARNAALGLEIAGKSRAQARAVVLPLFASFGLSDCEDLYPAALSGGMRQRVAFMRSIVQSGRYLLLDEPFSALDAVTRLQMQDWLLAQLRANPRGVLLVTHDLYEATALADRILVMGAGRIIADISQDLPPDARGDAALAPLRADLRSLLLKELPR